MIDPTTNTFLTDFASTHSLLLGGIWASIKALAVLHPGVDSNKIVDLFRLFWKVKEVP